MKCNHIIGQLTGSISMNQSSFCFIDKDSSDISLISCYEKSELICVK